MSYRKPLWWFEDGQGGVYPAPNQQEPEGIHAIEAYLADQDRRIVKRDERGGIVVFTRFEVLDMAIIMRSDPNAHPLLYETFVYRTYHETGGPLDIDMDDGQRYCTRELALRGHEELVKLYLGENRGGA